jgi:hypothetical protein
MIREEVIYSSNAMLIIIPFAARLHFLDQVISTR